ncbi:hypothetical protein S40293_11549 [Stachybotrys chartarum IBT 40293]|nr:hypothetical protein S40293_11549 [Stachybotrys chartarum IBT 40293]
MVSTIQRQSGGASSMQHQHSPQPSSAASTPAPTPSTITSGSQQPKRLRLACDSCHGAKIRCSGGQPCKKCHNSYMARLGKPKGSRNKKTLERLAAAAESPSNTSTTANGSGSGSSSSNPGSSEAMRKSLSHGAGTPTLSTSSLSEYDLHPSSASSTSSSVSSSSSAVSSASSAPSSALLQQQSPVGWPTLSPNLYAPMDHHHGHHGHHGLHNHHAAHQASLDLCLETSSLRGLLDADAGLSPASPEGLLPLSLISPMDKDTQSLLAYHSYLSPSTSDVLNPFDDKSDGDWGFGASLHQHRSAMAMSVADTSNTHSPSPMMQQQQQHASLANLAKSPPMSGISSSGSSVHGGNGSNTNAYGSPEHHDVSGMSMPSDDAARQQQQPPGACGCLRILTNKLCALNEVERKADHLRLDTTLSKGSAVLTCSATALACPLCLLDSKVILLVMTLLQTIINWARDGCGSSTAPQDSPPVVFGEWPVSREDGNAVRAVLITRVMTRTTTTLDVLRQRIRDFAAVAKQQKLAYQAMEAEALQATLQRVIHSMSEVTQMIKAKGLDA